MVRVGRYGTYVEDADGRRANVADDLPPDELTVDLARELLSKPMGEERELGVDPETGTDDRGPQRPLRSLRHRDAARGRARRTRSRGPGSLFASMSVDDVDPGAAPCG